jgi:hypothetical protein
MILGVENTPPSQQCQQKTAKIEKQVIIALFSTATILSA